MKRSTLLTGLLFVLNGFAAPLTPIPLWPGTPPDEGGSLAPETDVTKPGDHLVAERRVARLGNVAEPTVTIYPAAPEKNTGAALVVFPGGGYRILAIDLEGTEVGEWLSSIGVTAAVVKYRVPPRAGKERHEPPLQDAQRAIGLVRHRAKELGVDPQRIGVMGFSAGGHLAAVASRHFETRTYAGVDEADRVSCRPDFMALIYPAYLTDKDANHRVFPLVEPKAGLTPPAFIVMTQDDQLRPETAIFYYLALSQAGVPAELHLYPEGGHGYGLRRTDNPTTWWPERFADWLRASGWLTPAE